MDQKHAETLALQALAFLAKHEELLNQFVSQSGLSLNDLKKRAHEPELLGGVLDVILEDDKTLLSFCNLTEISPETLIKARIALPGGMHISV